MTPSLLILLAACRAGAGEPASPHASPEVRVWGSLHAIMAEGKIGATVAVADVAREPHAYALGALSELRGEIIMLDSHAIASYPSDGAVRLDEHADAEHATLLVASHVRAWKRIPIAEVIAAADVDAQIARLAAAAGVDTTRPFPFRIEGHFVDVAWHVLDGTHLPPDATHDQRMSAAVHGTLTAVDGSALGFYSTAHAGVFTHMGTHTHIHALIPAAKLMAHCDALGIAAGATLLVPE